MTRNLDIAFWNYDRVQPLLDGSVTIDGVTPRYHTSRIVTEIFEGMVRRRAYDVSELGFTYFLRTCDENGRSPFLLLPVFLNRAFRHQAIYVNKASGIAKPADLAGKRIGELALYGHDSGVMSKGVLSDDFGFKPEMSSWLVGGIDFPMDPINFVPRPVPAGVEVEWAGKGADLGKMLRSGEIDALISADIPEAVLERAPEVGRLFEDYEAVERDYFRRTGVFPIMHAVAVRRELAEDDPALVRSVYKAFREAKRRTQETYVRGMTFNNMAVMLPWLQRLIEQDRDLLGQDWWPYGVEANRAAIEAQLRYHHEQGLTPRRFAIEEIFVPDLLASP